MTRAFVILAFMVTAAQVHAQTVQVAKPRDVIYAGEAASIRIAAEGFEITPQLDCQPGQMPDGVWIRAAGTNHQSSSFSTFQNGRMVTKTQVTYIFGFEISADQPGTYHIPAFTVKQDKKTVTTEPFELTFKEAQVGDDMRIELLLPNQTIYPNQRVPVTVNWWYAGDLDNARDMSVRVPMFDRFEYVDEPIDRRNDSTMTLSTRAGKIRLKAQVQRRQLDGVEWIILSAKRTLIVNEPGEYDIAAPTTSVKKVTQWARDFFGARAVKWARQRAEGKAQKLIVKPLPLAQAPPGFAGAVGEGFGIDVAADRTVVQAGDPVKLTITLRGSGDLATASLPKLTGEAALDPKQFRVPAGDVPGNVTEDGKQFTVTARVLSDAVNEIPSIQYAWFNPLREVFETTRSDPIALRVGAAQMVTAGDVVGSKPVDAKPHLGQAAESAAPTKRRFNLTGADLAIEPVVAHLLVDDRQRLGGATARMVIYIVALALLPLAWMRRRAAQVDPAIIERRRLLRGESRQIVKAANLPKQEAAKQIAAALRQIAPNAHAAHRDDIDRLIATCDAIGFAPAADDNAPIDADIAQQARQIAQSVSRQTP